MTNWMTAVCKANGIDIHYLRTGEGNAHFCSIAENPHEEHPGFAESAGCAASARCAVLRR